MPKSSILRILHLEDDPDYCQLVRDLLACSGYAADVVNVATREPFEALVRAERFDVILGDFSLPDFTGLQALQFARKHAPETPFLLVSGTIGEQAAIESLRAGATDYVLKTWPERLLPAMRRAVDEAREKERRRQAEAELVRKEHYFRALTGNALDIVSLLDSAGFFLYNNPAVKRTLGYAPDELTGINFLDLLHPEDRPVVQTAFTSALAQPGGHALLEFRARHREGHWVPLEASGQNHLDDARIGAFVFNLRDATERKRIEGRHHALYHLGRSLSCVSAPFEAAELVRDVADQLFAWDVFFLDLQSAEADFTQPVLNVETVKGQRVAVKIPDGYRPLSLTARRVMANGAELVQSPDLSDASSALLPVGEPPPSPSSQMYAPIRNRRKVVGILSVQSYQPQAYTEADLETLQLLADHCGGALERIATEQAARENERRFSEIFVNSPDAIFVEDLLGNILDVNPAACHLHGVTRGELLGRNVLELVPVARQGGVFRDFQKLVEGSLRRLESECYSDDGRITPVEIRATRIVFHGEPALLLHVRDISDRKQAETALRSSEMRFHSVWENSVDGMRLTDEHGHIVAVNEAYCRLVGISRGELEQKPFTVIYAESEQPIKILRKYQQRFRERHTERQVERRVTLRSGATVVMEDTTSFVELRDQPPLLLGLFRDVTAQKKLEDQLRQSQKMEAIGQLAGGVAHDFNNILTVIQGHASLLLAGGQLTPPATRAVNQMVQASERAAGLTRQLLTFSRRQIMQPRRLDLNEVVANITKMLGRILGEDVALQVAQSSTPSYVLADAGMMEQVLLNLAVNARDAMPRGGQLQLQISHETIAPGTHRHAEARPGKFVCLTTTDTGSGIAPEILRRIFEPFFTTKEVGKGTGLGLATVYGIIKQHQGWIEVESQLSRGSTFRVYLAECSGEEERAEERREDQTVRGGPETILVVEDEQPVREMVCNLLQGHGYNILEAETGVRAMEVWKDHKQEIALLLTDVVMPDRLNGRELAELLWAEQPSLKVIFTSGYSPDVVGKDSLHRRGFNYVQKPYLPRNLAKAVRDCLDATDLTPAI